jgi:polar amino acid transport system substrate-binding protein
VDPQKVQQVFLNILLNAIQAMDESGEIAIRTSVEDGAEGRRLLVEIRDNGTGMSDETRRNSIRPFFTTKKTGTGLGLAIAQQVMESHDGSMELRSEPGHGTTVLLSFPM